MVGAGLFREPSPRLGTRRSPKTPSSHLVMEDADEADPLFRRATRPVRRRVARRDRGAVAAICAGKKVLRFAAAGGQETRRSRARSGPARPRIEEVISAARAGLPTDLVAAEDFERPAHPTRPPERRRRRWRTWRDQ